MDNIIIRTNGQLSLDTKIASELAVITETKKALADREAEIKDALIKEMAEKGILSLDSEAFRVTYIPPTERETFDSKAFKKAHSDLYDEYVKMSPVKASVRVTVR